MFCVQVITPSMPWGCADISSEATWRTSSFSLLHHVFIIFLVSLWFTQACYTLRLLSSASAVDPQAPNFLPVSSLFSPDELYGELEPADIEWKCESGFVTETQIWYTILEDGSSVMCQVIHPSGAHVVPGSETR